MEQIIKNILMTLEQNGYEAYLVGGYVRDLLLGNKSFDVDICTNAKPIDLQTIFGVTSSRYGITLKQDDFLITISTFRTESDYKGHIPETLEFVDKLDIDLKRRDFTINTLCMDYKENLIDLLNGRKDLEKKRICLVGEKERLLEDPLRMLRAIRLATVLDFTLDEKIEEGITLYREAVKQISGYRIKEEMDKILTSKNFQKGLALLEKFDLLTILNISYEKVVYTEDLCGMWAQLQFPESLPFTKNERERIVKIRELKVGD